MPLSPRIPRDVVTVPKRQREGEDAKHRAMVSRLPCLVCGREEQHGTVIDPHHLQRSLPQGERGMGRRASDQWSLPLCRKHHRWAESTGDDEAQLASLGIDGRAIAGSLWRFRGQPEKMRRVVERSLSSRGIYCA